MTVEFWTKAERFYEFGFLIVGFLLLVSVITVIFIVSYARDKRRNQLILAIVSLSLVVGSTGFFQHRQLHLYLEQAIYVNPLIRDRQPRLMTYLYYNEREQQQYSQLNHIESLRKSILYEEIQVKEPLRYLGQNGYFHYFERVDGLIFKKHQQIEFSKTIQQAQLVGSKFTLKNESFKEIGFKNPKNNMFECIKIPIFEKGRIYKPDDAIQIPTAEKSVEWWNF